ncbi:hypothetical protein [Trichothermofontia sp.]
MTPDDRPLVQFLRQYRPPAPPAAINLEDRLMAALTTTDWESDEDTDTHWTADTAPPWVTPSAPASRSRPWARQSRRWLMAGTALTASVIAAWSGQRLWRLAQAPSPTELAEIEQFMEQSWQGTVVSATTDVYNPFWPEVDFE